MHSKTIESIRHKWTNAALVFHGDIVGEFAAPSSHVLLRISVIFAHAVAPSALIDLFFSTNWTVWLSHSFDLFLCDVTSRTVDTNKLLKILSIEQ